MGTENILLPIELNERADADGISENEILSVIRACKETGDLVWDKEADTYTCHAEIENIVLWVRFRDSAPASALDSASASAFASASASSSVSASVSASASVIQVEDYYFNRTYIESAQDVTADEAARLSPYIKSYADKEMICVKCNQPLILKKVIFRYLQQNYSAIALVCPQCGLVFEPAEMIAHQKKTIESVLEWK
jgi:RNase P subunit RPR2